MHVVLIGMPGGGKSTVGRALARQLGWPFVDSDAELAASFGCSIAEFFARSGEGAFRDAEAAAIRRLTAACAPTVLATGGGAVLRAENRKALHESGTVIYLHATPEQLAARLRHDRKRPLLQVADPRAKLRELYRDRDPLYRRTAHFVIETGRPSAATLVNMIVMQLELAGLVGARG